MTGYGFCGPQTAMGTTFDAKAEAVTDTGMRFRYGYRANWAGLWVLLMGSH